MKKISFETEEKIILMILMILSGVSFYLEDKLSGIIEFLKNDFLDFVLNFFSLNFGLFLPILVFASAYLYYNKRKESIFNLWSVFGTTFVIVYALKFLIERPRPNGFLLTTLFSLTDYSFPSAHAALSFAIFAVIDEEFERIKVFWLALAIIISLSRVYFAYHYLSDVCFGALIGYFTGIMMMKIMEER